MLHHGSPESPFLAGAVIGGQAMNLQDAEFSVMR